MANSADFIIRLRDKLTGPARKATASLNRMGGSIRKISGMKFADRLGKQFKSVARYAGLAAVGIAAFAAKSTLLTGANYEQAITAVGAVGLQTRDQIALLDKEAKRLGATTKFTATESAQAMEIMAKAGFKNQEILAGVGGVLNAAAASGLEMAEVADHVSNVLKGMGLAASDATRVADVLALASSRTNSTIGSLGESMKNVAGTARDLNIPLEDTVAAVALLQDVGLDASVAGSAMNVMLTRMAKPTAGIAAKMEKFGVSFKDAQGNMLPFQEVLENISSAAAQSGGNMDRVAFLADLVGLRGQKAATKLARLFDEGKVGKLTSELYNAAGVAEEMAKLRMDNLIGDWTLLTSAVDGVQTSLYETQSGPLRGMVQGVTKWVNENARLIQSKFVSWVETSTQLVGALWDITGELAGGIGDVVRAILGLDEGASTIDALASKLRFLAEWISVNREELGTLARWIGRAGAAWLTMAYAIPAVTSAIRFLAPILKGVWFVLGLVAKGVGLLVASFGLVPVLIGAAIIGALAVLWMFRDEIWNWITGVWDDLSYFGSEMWNLGANLIQGLIDGVASKISSLVSKISEVGGVVMDAWRSVFDINSPSKEMRMVGQYNMEGLALGQEDGLPTVKRSAQDVSGATVSGAEVSGKSGGGQVINIRPTINFYGATPTANEVNEAKQSVTDMLISALEAAV
jgi:TP901 family phage tail tape measure protein